MVVIKYSREYDLDAETMWKVVGDFSNVHKVHPAVKSVDLLTPQENGLGAQRRCNFYGGGSVEEEITAWNDGRMTYKVDILTGTVPLKTGVAVFKIEPIVSGKNKSKVSVNFDYKVKYGPIGHLMGAYIMKPQFTGIFEKLFAGFAYHVKTGNEVGKDDTLAKLNAGAQ